MMTFEVEHTGSNKIQGLLSGLKNAFNDTERKNILRAVGTIYTQATRERFDKQYDVDRKKWKPLRPVTVRLKGHSKIGHKTGALRKSIRMRIQGDSVYVGTDLIYAKTFHYFVKKGQYGKTSRDQPIPWGNIPRRSFIGRNLRLDDKVIKMLKRTYKEKYGFASL